MMIFSPRFRRALVSAYVVSTLSLNCFAAHAVEVDGFKVDDGLRVGSDQLTLNGAGVGHMLIFKVYIAGIYLKIKMTKASDVLAAPGSKRILVVMLRGLGGEKIGREFISGVRKNTDKATAAKLMPQLQKFGEMVAAASELYKGDVLTMDWVPEAGTLVQLNGKSLGDPIPDRAFYDVLLRMYVGENPLDGKLKQQLLGETTDQNTGLPY